MVSKNSNPIDAPGDLVPAWLSIPSEAMELMAILDLILLSSVNNPSLLAIKTLWSSSFIVTVTWDISSLYPFAPL